MPLYKFVSIINGSLVVFCLLYSVLFCFFFIIHLISIELCWAGASFCNWRLFFFFLRTKLCSYWIWGILTVLRAGCCINSCSRIAFFCSQNKEKSFHFHVNTVGWVLSSSLLKTPDTVRGWLCLFVAQAKVCWVWQTPRRWSNLQARAYWLVKDTVTEAEWNWAQAILAFCKPVHLCVFTLW